MGALLTLIFCISTVLVLRRIINKHTNEDQRFISYQGDMTGGDKIVYGDNIIGDLVRVSRKKKKKQKKIATKDIYTNPTSSKYNGDPDHELSTMGKLVSSVGLEHKTNLLILERALHESLERNPTKQDIITAEASMKILSLLYKAFDIPIKEVIEFNTIAVMRYINQETYPQPPFTIDFGGVSIIVIFPLLGKDEIILVATLGEGYRYYHRFNVNYNWKLEANVDRFVEIALDGIASYLQGKPINSEFKERELKLKPKTKNVYSTPKTRATFSKAKMTSFPVCLATGGLLELEDDIYTAMYCSNSTCNKILSKESIILAPYDMGGTSLCSSCAKIGVPNCDSCNARAIKKCPSCNEDSIVSLPEDKLNDWIKFYESQK